MTTRTLRVGLSCLPLILTVMGCGNGPQGWTPVLEETSTTFLQSTTERAIASIRTARARVSSDPAEAEAALDHAEAILVEVSSYYLPLFRAREHAYNAYRYFHLRDRGRMVAQLDRIEQELLQMTEGVGPPVRREIAEVLGSVADTRVATSGSNEEARRALELLARKLDLIVLKGDLILPEGR